MKELEKNKMDGHDNIPPFFLCPISLQIMKDPVTVSSGISYDRSSIARWLSVYDRRSCPVTNQPLLDRSLTPNTTLLNLINSWADKSNPNSQSKSDSGCELVIPLSDPRIQMKSLQKIALSAQADPGCTARMERAGIASYVASMINYSNLANSSDVVREAAAVLHLLSPSPQALKQIVESENAEFVETLILILQRGSYCAAFLFQLILKSVSDSYKKDLPSGLFDWVVEVLKDQNSNLKVTMAALSILVEVLPYGRNRASAVEAGVVTVVVELLAEERDERRRYCEAMLLVLELLCRKAEGRSALVAHPAGIAAVAGKVLRVSPGATERAVRVLGLLCRNVCGGAVVEEMVAIGGVAKLCMVVQVEGNKRVREMAKGILGLHMNTWIKSPCFLYYSLNT